MPKPPPTPTEIMDSVRTLGLRAIALGERMQYLAGFNGRMVTRGKELASVGEVLLGWGDDIQREAADVPVETAKKGNTR